VNLLVIFETSRRTSRNVDFGSGSASKVVRLIAAGDNSGDMLSGSNARALAPQLSEQLKHAFGRE
jgi:hypothetical protein